MSVTETSGQDQGWPAFWRCLRADVILTAWPEVHGPEHPIFRVTQAERMPWRDRWDRGKLAAPWVVVQYPPVRPEPGWGACNVVYRPLVTVYYVAADNTSGDIAGFVESKLAVLERVLTAQQYRGFQFWPGETTYDVTEDNPANRALLASNTPVFAGSLTFRAVFGYVASPLYRFAYGADPGAAA